MKLRPVLLALVLACGHNSGGVQDAPPAPHISAPADGAEVRAGTPVTFAGSAVGAVQLQWKSSLQGDLGFGARLTVALVAGTHAISLTATGAGGLSATAQITVHAIAAPNQPPAPVIDAPKDGASFDQGQAVVLQGHADDPEDGALPASALSWTSSLDGPLGSGASVTMPAPSLGTHRIVLTATDRQGLSAYASISISVVAAGSNHAPVASISSPSDGASFVEGSVVSLSGSATDAEDGALGGSALAWSSSLDGALGSGSSVSSSTLRRGVHTITLTATDSAGATGSASVGISIVQAGNHAPVATITAPADGAAVFAGTAVTFSGSATDAEDGPLSGSALQWSSSRDGALGTGASLTLSTLSAGAHVIRLTATDSRGDSGAASIGLTVLPPNQPPVAQITSPADGASFDAGQTVQLRGSADDPEDGALSGASLTWTSSLDGLLGHGASLDTASLQPGAHTITLSAIDSGGRTGSASIGVTIRPAAVNLPPVARLLVPAQALVAETLTADGSASSDSDGSIASYAFDFGDGSAKIAGSAAKVTHAWATAGAYTVTLTVTDDKGATGSATASVTVSAVGRVPGVIDASSTFGATCSLAIGSGAVVIAYRDMVHPGVRLATVASGGAAIERVDGMGYEVGGAVDDQLALTLSPDGTPQLAYTLESGAVWYATRQPGGWLRERVDGGIARQKDSYGFVAIALDPTRASRPAVFYESPAGVVAAARGTGWSDTSLTDNGAAGAFWGGLAIDGAGVARFSLYSAGWRVGAWSGSGGTFTDSDAIASQPAYQAPIPVAIDPSGAAVTAFSNAVARLSTLSPFEESDAFAPALFVDGQGAAWLAFGHAGNLEIATALDGGWFRRTSLGPMDPDGRPSIAVDAQGNARACFFRSGKLMLF